MPPFFFIAFIYADIMSGSTLTLKELLFNFCNVPKCGGMTFQRKCWLQLVDLFTKDGNDSNMVSISLNLYYIINFTAFQNDSKTFMY